MQQSDRPLYLDLNFVEVILIDLLLVICCLHCTSTSLSDRVAEVLVLGCLFIPQLATDKFFHLIPKSIFLL